MPLTPDLGLVMQKDCVTINLQPRGVALEVEIKLSQGDDVGFGPASLSHVVKQAGPGNQHLTPGQVFVRDDLA